MKKLIFFIFFSIALLQGYGQVKSVVPVRGDTLKVGTFAHPMDLTLLNDTKDSVGIAVNIGGGVVKFQTPFRINDSTIQIGPIVIIVGTGTSHGDTIYIAAALDTFFTVPIGTAAGMIQTMYTITGINFSEIRHSNWGPGLYTIPALAADSLARIDLDSGALIGYLRSTYGLGSGLYAIPGIDDVLAVGQSLTTNRTIDDDVNFLTVTGSGTKVLQITNTGANAGVSISTSTGTGVSAITTSSGTAIFGRSVDGIGGNFAVNPASTNTIVDALQITISSSGGAPGNGIGTGIAFSVQDISGFSAGHINYSLIDATHATATSRYEFVGLNNGAVFTGLTLNGDGGTQLNGYGSGTFTGTPTFNLSVTSTGDVIETTAGGSVNHIASQSYVRGVSPSSSATVADILWAANITNQPVKIETTGYWVAGSASTNYNLSGSLGFAGPFMTGWAMTINSGVQQEGTFRVTLTFNPQTTTNSYGSIETIWTRENASTFLNEVQQHLIDASNYITLSDLGQHQQSVITTPAGLTLSNCTTVVTLVDPSL